MVTNVERIHQHCTQKKSNKNILTQTWIWKWVLLVLLAQNVVYTKVPGHRNHRSDPASELQRTHWWRQHPTCQHCLYQPLRNCHPSQRVSTSPVETLTLGHVASGGALAPEPLRATRSQPESIRKVPQKTFFSTFFWVELLACGSPQKSKFGLSLLNPNAEKKLWWGFWGNFGIRGFMNY